MIKVMLVDDSKLTLSILKKILATATDIVVVGTALNGREALTLLHDLNPDVICTDLLMPVMDGLTFIKALMADFPRPILVLSAAVQSTDTANVFNLMQAGAIDVMAKPNCDQIGMAGLNSSELIHKIRVLSGVHVIARKKKLVQQDPQVASLQDIKKTATQIIGIGASTGGPQALWEILTQLPVDFALPVVCVQHITKGFSAGLVNWLAHDCKLAVQFAETGMKPLPGHVYFAPDDRQLEINTQNQFACTLAPRVGGHLPSITVTLQSLALRFGSHAAGVLLTGMGRDGVNGLQAIKQVGGVTIAQDEASCIVFGMPKVAIEEQAANLILPLPAIAQVLLNLSAPSN